MTRPQKMQAAVDRLARDREIAGLVVSVVSPRDKNSNEKLSWSAAKGEMDLQTPFFIASTTKLYTSAILLRMAERGVLTLDDRLIDHVEPDLVKGLHVFKGTDFTAAITLRHLMSQTSGLADYFSGRPKDGVGPDKTSLEKRVRAGNDQSWSAEDALSMARGIGAAFPPGAENKALYSDTNYQLLGRVIEQRLGMSYQQAVSREIAQPLGLTSTWVYDDPSDTRPVPLRDGSRQLHIPLAMTSFAADGGIVATADDLMHFLRGFFEGRLFDPAVIPTLEHYNRIFFPFRYGVGLQRFQLPRWMSPFVPPPALIGHSGLSGAFAFYAPDRGTFLCGTVNNLARPSRSFKLMLRLLGS